MSQITKEIIRDGDVVLAIVLQSGDFPEGLNFHTKDWDFVQVATWNYPKGRRSSTHSHRVVDRIARRTQEVWYVKKGKVKVEIYSEDDRLLAEPVLEAGDIMIIFGGGHASEILEDGTQVLEVKNGPYLGPEKDKRNIKLNS